MTITRLGNGAYQISAMVEDNFSPSARLETQTYYGYTKEQAARKYRAHLISRMYKEI